MGNATKLIKSKLLLSENAKLFDTKEYLFKTFVAVFIAGMIGLNNNYVSKDMISLLFGMLLTLEPVNMAGIRSGLSQMQATIIGATVTGIIIALMGYTVLATAIGITLTLYVCMIINWRELMVVAVFTSIYMTQYVQLNDSGQESSFETFKLRVIALGTGVLIAVIVNFIFSLLGYKKMVNKRIYYISKELYEYSFDIKMGLIHKDEGDIMKAMIKLPHLFNTIDWVTSTLTDVKHDQVRFKFVYRHFDVDKYLEYSIALRGITHIVYDLCYRIQADTKLYMHEDFIISYEERLGYFEIVKDAFNHDKVLPKAQWKETNYPWLNRYSGALEKLTVRSKKNT